MVQARPETPAGHGEVVTRPDFARWPSLIDTTRLLREKWDFSVAGMPVGDLVALAQSEAAEMARGFSARLGVPVRGQWEPCAPIVMTGHQPELYHPGVWIKDFLLHRLSHDTGALGIDVVVDSDAFNVLAIQAPCMRPDVSLCREYLAIGGDDVCYACADTPTTEEVDTFSRLSLEMLSTLPAPSIARHFGDFALALHSAARDSTNLAELVTFARRRYEASAGTDYLELPVTSMVRGEAFARFFVDIALRCDAFAEVLNAILGAHRVRAGLRNTAQPFPDLIVDADSVELPFWLVGSGRRAALTARRTSSGVTLTASGAEVLTLPADFDAAVAAVVASGLVIAPRAVTLTMYLRFFIADVFIHGIGGGRYDVVTDAVARAWYGVEPPPYAVASMTLYLPLGAHVVSDEEIDEVRNLLNKLEHNPDQLLDEIVFDDPAEAAEASELAVAKRELVREIGAPGADKKALGKRIREVNASLAAALAPVRHEYEERLDRLMSERQAAEILTDRTYPFCFWSPAEVADKIG